MWGGRGMLLQAPQLSSAGVGGLHLSSSYSYSSDSKVGSWGVQAHTRSSRICPRNNGHMLVVEAKDEGPKSVEELAANNVRVAPKTTRRAKKSIAAASCPDGDSPQLLHPVSVTIPVGNRHIVVETGLMGRQANGAVTVTDGETMLYTTACASLEPSEPSDFLPLTVNYQERFSAAGRTSGGFIKREGRARDHEILVCRLIDRPIRPMIAHGYHRETQLLVWVLSYDGVHSPEPLAITSAGAALALSDIPMSKPVAGVRVGLLDGKLVVNPTIQEMEKSKLDMVIAGTSDAVLMIED